MLIILVYFAQMPLMVMILLNHVLLVGIIVIIAIIVVLMDALIVTPMTGMLLMELEPAFYADWKNMVIKIHRIVLIAMIHVLDVMDPNIMNVIDAIIQKDIWPFLILAIHARLDFSEMILTIPAIPVQINVYIVQETKQVIVWNAIL